MQAILEQITIAARKSKFIDQQSGVSAQVLDRRLRRP